MNFNLNLEGARNWGFLEMQERDEVVVVDGAIFYPWELGSGKRLLWGLHYEPVRVATH